jgi:hypothetical protein
MSPMVSFVSDDTTPSQYIGGAGCTTALNEGAPAMLKALRLIRHRIETTLGKRVDFKEVLSAAYMEKQMMAVSRFHVFCQGSR